MINELNSMSDEDRETFGKCVQKLLSKTFVIEKLYHKEKSVIRNPIYSFIEEHESLFSEYLRFGGFELECDVNNGVYFILSSLTDNNVIFSKVTTIFLLVIRLMYEEKQESVNIGSFITFTMEELLRKIEILNLNTGLISDSKIKQGMRDLSKYNLVEKIKGNYIDTSSMYVIYPSIIKCIDGNAVRSILNEFKKMNDVDLSEGDEEE